MKMRSLSRTPLRLAGVAVGLAMAQPAAAELIWSEGCISWSINGCSRMQSCWVDTISGHWNCVAWFTDSAK